MSQRRTWNEFFELYNTLTNLLQRHSRDSVIAEESADPDCQEIGSSDVSAFLYGEFGQCKTKEDLIKAIDVHMKIYLGFGLVPPCFRPEYDQEMENGFMGLFS